MKVKSTDFENEIALVELTDLEIVIITNGLDNYKGAEQLRTKFNALHELLS